MSWRCCLTASVARCSRSHPSSPAYVRVADARQRISCLVLRQHSSSRSHVCRARDANQQPLLNLNADVSRRLGQDERGHSGELPPVWLESVPQTERPASAETCKYLLAGKLPWTAAKGLYDAGIMYRSASSDIIAPSRRGHLRAVLSSILKYYLRERGSAAVVYHRRPPSGRRAVAAFSGDCRGRRRRGGHQTVTAPRAARFACRARTRCPSTQWTRCCLERRLCSTCQCR